MKENPPGDPIPPHAPTLEDAVCATLLFHSASPWTEQKRQQWERLTGTTEATTRHLCDTCRKALEGA